MTFWQFRLKRIQRIQRALNGLTVTNFLSVVDAKTLVYATQLVVDKVM